MAGHCCIRCGEVSASQGRHRGDTKPRHEHISVEIGTNGLMAFLPQTTRRCVCPSFLYVANPFLWGTREADKVHPGADAINL
jgi:hypothetical protein